MTSASGLGDTGGWWRLGLWIATTLGYGALSLALAAWRDAVGSSAARNLLVLTGIWLILAIVLPCVIDLVAVMTCPVPPRLQLVQAARAARDAAGTAANEEAMRQAFIERHCDRVRDQASLHEAMMALNETAPAGNPVLDPVFARHPDLAGDQYCTQSHLFHVLLAAQEEEVERQTQALRDRLAESLAATALATAAAVRACRRFTVVG